MTILFGGLTWKYERLIEGLLTGTGYHIRETPMMEYAEFKHSDDNTVYIRPEDHAVIGALIDWLIDKQQSRWHMAISMQRPAEIEKVINKELEAWGYRAGQNSMIIRTNGSLAPCFPMYSSNHDWGTIEAPRMEPKHSCARNASAIPIASRRSITSWRFATTMLVCCDGSSNRPHMDFRA